MVTINHTKLSVSIVSSLHKSVAPLWLTLLLSGAGFAYTDAFIDGDIKAKWYAVLVCLALAGMSFSLCKRKKKIFEQVAWVVTLLVSLQALYGIGQFAGVLPAHQGFHTVGNFDNPAGYAAMLACSVPLVLQLAFAVRGWRRWVVWVVYGLLAVALVLSGSRAGLLAGFAVTALFVARRWRPELSGLPVWVKGLGVLSAMVLLCGMYVIKKDSADGRVLIWRCTAEMIADKPLFGHGYGSFEAEYMLYQARHFERNPDSRFALLADNVKHPFNEFLLLTAEGGFVALGIAFSVFIGLFGVYVRNKSKRVFVGMAMLCSVLVLSLFTYPFKYPFTWLTVLLGIVLVCENVKLTRGRNIFLKYSAVIGVMVLSFILLVSVMRDMYYENRWQRGVNRSMLGKTNELLPEYEEIASYLKRNAYFLYNYAAELNDMERYEESQVILSQCEKMLNDYDVQMLAGDNYCQLNMYEQAEKHFRTASNMCPNRFMPLFRLAQLYEEIGDCVQLEKQAHIIIEKEVKVPSIQIMEMKREMERKLSDKSL